MLEIVIPTDCLEAAEPFGPFGLRLATRRHGEGCDFVVGRFDPIVRDRLVARFAQGLTGPRVMLLAGRLRPPEAEIGFRGRAEACTFDHDRGTVAIYWKRPRNLEENSVTFETRDPALARDLVSIINGTVPVEEEPDVSEVFSVPAARLDEMIAARDDPRPADQQPTGRWSPRPHEPVDAASLAEMSHHRKTERNRGGG